MKNTKENNAKVKAIKKISQTRWVGNTIHETLGMCLVALNMESANSGWYNPTAVKISGLDGFYMVNEDGSIFCEARINKVDEKKYKIEYMTKTGWSEFEKLYSSFIGEN